MQCNHYQYTNSIFHGIRTSNSKICSKRPPTEWEKMLSNNVSDKQLISKEFIQLNREKKKFKWAEDLNRHFPKEDILMTNRHKTPGITNQVNANQNHSKTSTQNCLNGYHQKTTNKCWQGRGEKGTAMHCWEYKWVQLLWKTVWRLLKKSKLELPYNIINYYQ